VNRNPKRLRRDRQTAPGHPAESGRPRTTDDAQRDHLETLAHAVEAITPLQARLFGPTAHGPMLLRAVNPGAGHLTETIGCHIEQVSGQYWYFWHWTNGQRDDTIGPADDPHGTAQTIAHVLRPDTGHV
jgi:hypothetical protein